MATVDIESEIGQQACALVLENLTGGKPRPEEIEGFKRRLNQMGQIVGACHILQAGSGTADGLVACISVDTQGSASVFHGPYAQNSSLEPTEAQDLIGEAQKDASERGKQVMQAQTRPEETRRRS